MSSEIKSFYYYIKTTDNHPRITICIVADDTGSVSRGISICSMSETPVKAEGKKIARKRAIKAFYAGKYDKDMDKTSFSREESLEVLRKISLEEYLISSPILFYHGEFNPILTTYEIKILSKILNVAKSDRGWISFAETCIPQQH